MTIYLWVVFMKFNLYKEKTQLIKTVFFVNLKISFEV